MKMSQEMAQLKVTLMEKECESLDLRLEKVSLVTKIDNITFLNEDLFQITLKQNDRYVSVVEKKRTIEDENAELRQDAVRLNEQVYVAICYIYDYMYLVQAGAIYRIY